MQFRTLKNDTLIPQSVVYKGMQHVLLAREEKNFANDVAAKFLEICGSAVRDTTENMGSIYTIPSEHDKYMWLANMTGDPDLPDKVLADQYDEHSRLQKVEVDNPIKQFSDLRWEIKGGTELWYGADGVAFQRTLDSKWVGLPAKRRIRVEKDIGFQIMQRNARAMVKGAVIVSREPAEFEPKMEWELDDIRAYFKLIDPTASVGDNEEFVTKGITDKAKRDQAVLEAKQGLLHRLYYRLVNPKYRLPTRAEFREYVTGKPTEEVVREELEHLVETAEKDAKRGMRKLNA